MKKILTSLSVIVFSLTFSSVAAQTASSPYTVAQLLEQKDALAASGDTVWVRADLKGLGEDGTQADNFDKEDEVDGKSTTVKQLAALFGDDTATFTAYSWQILGQLALSDLTNTKDLLIALTYQAGSHYSVNDETYEKYGYQYADDFEPKELHFSLVEVRGALQLAIADGLRGYHVASCIVIPRDVIAVKVSAGYSSSKGAYVNYTNYDGADETINRNMPKNAALVMMANPGTYDVTLTTSFYNQSVSNGNALSGGIQAGTYTGTTKNRALYRFVSGDNPGFERNSQENCTVILQARDEVYMTVSSLDNNFMGKYEFETADKNWITWGGGRYTDYHDAPVTMKGDVNGDNAVNVADISAIIDIMAAGVFEKAADVNGDNAVNVADISAVIDIMAGN